jgi:hypothetical protein
MTYLRKPLPFPPFFLSTMNNQVEKWFRNLGTMSLSWSPALGTTEKPHGPVLRPLI